MSRKYVDLIVTEWNLMNQTGCYLPLVFCLITSPSLLSGDEPDQKANMIRAETPQALMAAYRQARASKNWRECFGCCDSKMRGLVCIRMLQATGFSRDAKLATIVKKHLRVEFTDPFDVPIPGLRRDERLPDELLVYEAFQKRVADLPGFVDEFGRRRDEMGAGPLFEDLSKVREIKTQGDHATGVLLVPGPGRRTLRAPIHFRRIGDRWYWTYPDPPPPTERDERAERLKSGVESLTIELTGSAGTFIQVRLSVNPFVYRSRPRLHLVRLTEVQAKKLIDHLALEGFLENAVEPRTQRPPRQNPKFYYSLQVSTGGQGGLLLHENLGWGPGMLKRLKGLHGALEGDGAEAMEAVISALTDDRKEWPKDTQK